MQAGGAGMGAKHMSDPTRKTGGSRWIEEHQTGMPLFEFDDEAVAYDKVLAGLRQSQLRLVGPELIYGTLFDRIGYDKVNTADNDLFRALAITRLYHPGSKLRTSEYMERFILPKPALHRKGIPYEQDRPCHTPDLPSAV